MLLKKGGKKSPNGPLYIYNKYAITEIRLLHSKMIMEANST